MVGQLLLILHIGNQNWRDKEAHSNTKLYRREETHTELWHGTRRLPAPQSSAPWYPVRAQLSLIKFHNRSENLLYHPTIKTKKSRLATHWNKVIREISPSIFTTVRLFKARFYIRIKQNEYLSASKWRSCFACPSPCLYVPVHTHIPFLILPLLLCWPDHLIIQLCSLKMADNSCHIW